MSWIRLALVIDCALAAIAGIQGTFWPATWHGSTSAVVLPDAGLDQVRLLGTVYFNYAVLVGVGLWRGDAGFWRAFLVAAAVGDLTHLVFFLRLLSQDGAYWGPTAVANIVYVALYVPFKLWLAADPSRACAL